MKKLLAILALLGVCAFASPDEMAFTVPKMKPPVIDGVIDAAEWKSGVEIYGTVLYNSKFLTRRQGSMFFGMDNGNVYFAARTELPPEGMELLNRVTKRDGAVFCDDCVEFIICPPDEKFVYQVLANASGTLFDQKYPIVNGGVTHTDYKAWDANAEVKSTLANGYWNFEMRLPLSDLEQTGNKPGSVWRILAGRDWQHPGEQSTLKKAFMFVKPEDMAVATYAPDMPYVSFRGLGANAQKGDFNIDFVVRNPGKVPVEVVHQMQIISDAAPRSNDNTVTVAAGKSAHVRLKFVENTSVIRHLIASFKDGKSGKVLYQREFVYDPNLKTTWVSPAIKKGVELEFGVYPYYNLVRTRYGNPDDVVSNWTKAEFSIQDDKGKALVTAAGDKTQWGWEGRLNHHFEPGEYTLKASFSDKQGNSDTQVQKFKVDKFPWEHNQLGMDRIILPPFKELLYKGERAVECTMTSYAFGENGFVGQVTADGEELLKEPIYLEINGKKIAEKSFQFVEKSKDCARTRSELAWDGGKIQIDGLLDYDGLWKFELFVSPDSEQKIDSAAIVVPFKRKYASLIHSTCNKLKYNIAAYLPQGDGLVWQSSKMNSNQQILGNFRPYVWIGNMGRGIAWVSPSDKYWSLDREKDALELLNAGDTASFRINLVNKPCTWKVPFSMTQAFQASPVKPQPEYRRKLLERMSADNAVCLSTLAGEYCWSAFGGACFFPIDYDYSFINYLRNRKFSKEADKEMVEGFMAKHCGNMSADTRASFERHLYRGIGYAKSSKYIVPYFNSRTSSLDWKDYQTYMDEWWCSEYRAMNSDAYNHTNCQSYRDMALYYAQKAVAEGLDGIYYDNVRDWTNPNPVTGPAYRREDKQMQPYFDILEQRELIKRTAVMLYMNKKVFPDGRPVLITHMTNTNIVPLISFSTIQLDMEAEYGSKDFQDRFSEGYIRSCTLALQTGLIPEILIEISGKNTEFVARTFMAVILPYDLPFIMHCSGASVGISNRIWRKLYSWGYSTPDVKVSTCWQEDTLKSTCPDWRIATYRKGKEIAAAIGNMKDTATAEIDLPGMTKCVNWETGAEIPVIDGKISITLPRHDFILIKAE